MSEVVETLCADGFSQRVVWLSFCLEIILYLYYV